MDSGLDHQLQMNRQTWAQLNDLGVRPGDSLTIDGFFFAPNKEAAAQLARDLTRAGWVSRVSSSRTGLLRRTSWHVQASGPVSSVDLAALDVLVADFEVLAMQNGAIFDGWGTEAPPAPN
ncbi:ribonuclease E inhibitor RraB [Propionicimonas sp.]|uniref:ribonuclease E inhibitor RraB n=1 Tax=Propionicimonas sp. TaxID=1955623 RepID=UPI0039E28AAE